MFLSLPAAETIDSLIKPRILMPLLREIRADASAGKASNSMAGIAGLRKVKLLSPLVGLRGSSRRRFSLPSPFYRRAEDLGDGARKDLSREIRLFYGI